MLKRSIVVAACAAVLAFAGVAQAQDHATLVLRSGERITGELIDLGGVGFSISVNGTVRRVPQRDVAVIEFTGGGGSLTDEMNSQLRSGRNVVLLRSGDTVTGNLYDISGKAPLKIAFDTPSGRREFNSNQIRRIYLRAQGGSAVSTGGTTTQPDTGGGIAVPANQQWIATGIIVRKGEVFNFNTTGEVRLSTNPNDRAQPSGSFNGRKAAGAPLPDELAGALIGRIGNGQPFGIGNLQHVEMPGSGPLYLGINDDGFGDNSGQFNVVITRPGRR